MKSLEIVNYKISLFEKDKQGFTALSWFQLNDIKQDLEVLEILKKYIPENWNGFQIIMSDKKTKWEDWKKVKQWLKENENE